MKKDIAFGGVSRTPGGALSSDGDLMAAVDVCHDGVGLQLLEKPRELFELASGETLLCVHEPEGEEKHYITLWEVPVATSLRAGDAPVDGDEGDEEEEVLSVPKIIDDTPYATATGPSPYSPPTAATSTVEGYYDDWIESNSLVDNGGITINSNSIVGGHIYLCYWKLENNQYSRLQTIDITPYGKVTTVQPIGNTLVCNHEGGEDYPREIRYWLWKDEDIKYIGLGSKPPMIDISFGLESTFEWYPKTESILKTDKSDYKRYGGIHITSYPYTDTVPVWFSDFLQTAWVPPYQFYQDGTYTYPNGFETNPDNDVFSHWQSNYSIADVVSPDGKTDVSGMKVNWTTMALGAYNKFIAEQTKDNKFVFPFYVRYAIEMYDGSLIMHSCPVLMIPNSRGPIFALDGRKGLKADRDDKGESYEKVKIEFQGRVYGFSSKLMYELKTLAAENLARLKNWKDLIRGLNIYVTPPIYNYKQGGQVLGWKCMDYRDPANNITTVGVTPWSKYYTVGKVKYSVPSQTPGAEDEEQELNGMVTLDSGFTNIIYLKGQDEREKIFWPWSYEEGGQPYDCPIPDYVLDIPQKEDEEVMELHESAGQFYKLAEINFEKLVEIAETAQGEKQVETKRNVLNTISNQDVMQDDNGSHDTMSADVLYGYNRRLNMAGVSKILSSPLKPSVVWSKDYAELSGVPLKYPYQITIYAKNGAEIARLKSSELDVSRGYPQSLFYPNTDAVEALIIRGLEKFRVPLKEHKALNGAFWISDILNNPVDLLNYKLDGLATEDELNLPEVNKTVDESNKIYTSETDNPFYVPSGNINIAGGGEVRALAAATTAMSQGQFGQHPLYCFTSEGVWAMTVNDSGGWATIQPVTRDVITDGTKPLSLDSTVVFLTERGLLQLAGSDVKVLSDVLQGADPLTLPAPNIGLHKIGQLCDATGTGTLLNVASALAAGKFPEQAWLAYDYDNARIYVSPWSGGGSWVYNLKSGLWTQASVTISTQITTYPELETQSGASVIRISVDRAVPGNLREKGLVISRPVKLGDMGLLKRWREIAVRGRFKPYSTAVQVALWGTRDWVDHALVASSTRNRLTRWSGTPYFGHSVGLFMTRPDFAMTVAGMDVEVDTEHDTKLR